MKRSSTFALVFALLLGASLGCSSGSSGGGSSRVCCNETDDAGGGFSQCLCGPEGTNSAMGFTVTITVTGSSCSVSGSFGNFTGAVVGSCGDAG